MSLSRTITAREWYSFYQQALMYFCAFYASYAIFFRETRFYVSRGFYGRLKFSLRAVLILTVILNRFIQCDLCLLYLET